MITPDKRQAQRMGSAGFTVEEVARIKRNLANGMSKREIATVFGCAIETIRKIARGDTFAWVDPEEDYSKPMPPITEGERIAVAASEKKLLAMLAQEDKPRELPYVPRTVAVPPIPLSPQELEDHASQKMKDATENNEALRQRLAGRCKCSIDLIKKHWNEHEAKGDLSAWITQVMRTNKLPEAEAPASGRAASSPSHSQEHSQDRVVLDQATMSQREQQRLLKVFGLNKQKDSKDG